MIIDILGSLFAPHLLAFLLLFRIAMFQIRPDSSNSVREDTARLWRYVYPHWRIMVAHPLYWAGCGIVSAFFLSSALRRFF